MGLTVFETHGICLTFNTIFRKVIQYPIKFQRRQFIAFLEESSKSKERTPSAVVFPSYKASEVPSY